MINLEYIKENVVTVIFSKDRPMQLDLCLTSNIVNSTDWEAQKEIVLYSASNEEFEKAYENLIPYYTSVEFIKQTDFKKDLLSILKDKSYVLFIVDDCVFTREYSLTAMCYALGISPNLLGFSLRLGKNTTECYPLWKKNIMPQFIQISDNPVFETMSCFDWTKIPDGDFGYPLELSSSLYRIGYIKEILEDCIYNTPNSLEWDMACNLQAVSHVPLLACYNTSVAFCNPINKVQNENSNRYWNREEYSIDSLLKKFNNGERIDYTTFRGLTANGCHQEIDLKYYKEGNL